MTESIPLKVDGLGFQLFRNEHGNISCWHSEIKGDVFMYTPLDNDEPTSYKKAL